MSGAGSILRGGHGDLDLGADVVVVGSGAGGAVVAAELAESGRSVLVLEEGPHVTAEAHGRMRPTESMRHLWRDGAMAFALGLGDTPSINVMMGRGVGGSSRLTGGVCFRIPERVLEAWGRDHGLADLAPDRLEPLHDEIEAALGVTEVPAAMRSRSTELFGEGLEALGHGLRPLRRNTDGCAGLARCNFGCPRLAKRSVDLTHLPRALGAGAVVHADCRVERVETRGGRAVGVRGRVVDPVTGRPRGRLRVRARRVVLSAGAWMTPALLLQSGIRPTREVGRNMTLHPGFRVLARFDAPVEGWRGALQSAYSDAFEAEGITLVSLFMPPGPLVAILPGVGRAWHRLQTELPNLAVFGGMIHDLGGGRIRVGPGGTVLPTYRMSARDRVATRTLLSRMAEIWFAAGAREVFLPVMGLPPLDADGFRRLDLDKIPLSRVECASQHPLGTCRMGTDPKRSVVDPHGRVWGVDGLWVADGSILPSSLGVNPQVAVMTMALHVARRMAEQPLQAAA